MPDSNGVLTAFFLIEVGARASKKVTDHLFNTYGEIIEAAAVYAGADVVICVKASQDKMAKILLDLLREAIPITVGEKSNGEPKERVVRFEKVKPLIVKDIIFPRKEESGTSYFNAHIHNIDKRDICAYLICDIRDGEEEDVFAALKELSSIRYIAELHTKGKGFLKLCSKSKEDFDNTVMVDIQKISGISKTKTLVIVNTIHHGREEIQEVTERKNGMGKKAEADLY